MSTVPPNPNPNPDPDPNRDLSPRRDGGEPTSSSRSSIPYVHGRHLLPIRVAPRRFPNHRIDALLAEEDHTRQRIDEIDQALVDLAAERRRLLERIGDLQHELHPPLTRTRGRRRRQVSHEEPLPPVEGKPTWLSGRELRAICLAFLRKARAATTLRQLHVLLHRAGYAVASSYPAKTLADALGHEADARRVLRVRRATYQLIDEEVAPTSALPDW